MRRLIQLGVVAFTITLAIVVGNRLSSEAMAVVVGVVCGVLASIPMSVMILILTRRLSGSPQPHGASPGSQGSAYPPVIVIQPHGQGSTTRYELPWDAPAPGANQPQRRSFKVVGDEEEW